MLITQNHNAIIKTTYSLIPQEITEIIRIHMPTGELTSYMYRSLLPVLSKLSEKFLIKKIQTILENSKIIDTTNLS